MKKYKFRLSETNYVEFTQKDLDGFRNVEFTNDNGKGKIIPITRQFDKQNYQIIVPMEMIEEVEWSILEVLL